MSVQLLIKARLKIILYVKKSCGLLVRDVNIPLSYSLMARVPRSPPFPRAGDVIHPVLQKARV